MIDDSCCAGVETDSLGDVNSALLLIGMSLKIDDDADRRYKIVGGGGIFREMVQCFSHLIDRDVSVNIFIKIKITTARMWNVETVYNRLAISVVGPVFGRLYR